MKVLLIEDDAGITSFLTRGLASDGHETDVIADGGEAMAIDDRRLAWAEMVLLDLTLPTVDGGEVLKMIRSRRADLPVIVLTARHRIADKVGMLDGGADDYVTKPFELAELLARMRAAGRQAADAPALELRVEDLSLDLLSKTARRGNRRIELAPREWTLLEFFMRSPMTVFSREQILAAVWGIEFDTSSNVVDVYIGYVRKKLNRTDEKPLLNTIRGLGYRLLPA